MTVTFIFFSPSPFLFFLFVVYNNKNLTIFTFFGIHSVLFAIPCPHRFGCHLFSYIHSIIWWVTGYFWEEEENKNKKNATQIFCFCFLIFWLKFTSSVDMWRFVKSELSNTQRNSFGREWKKKNILKIQMRTAFISSPRETRTTGVNSEKISFNELFISFPAEL